LQSLVSLEMHKEVFKTITLFREGNYPGSFYAWLGSRLRHMCTSAGQYIYQEGDLIHNIYFMHKGLAGFALPRYNSIYILVEPGDIFGVVDIVYNNSKNKEDQLEEPEEELSSKSMLRKFTIQCIEDSQFIMLSVENLNSMKIEFPEIYEDIFVNKDQKMWLTLQLKLRAHELLEEKSLKALYGGDDESSDSESNLNGS